MWHKVQKSEHRHAHIAAYTRPHELPLDLALFNLQSCYPGHYQKFYKNQMKIFSLHGNDVSVWNILGAANIGQWPYVDTRAVNAGNVSCFQPLHYTARPQLLGQQCV